MFEVNELIEASGGELIRGNKGVRAGGISIDTRNIRPQDVFIAIKGNNFDGHNFVDEAVRKGASCIIRERSDERRTTNDERRKVTIIEVKDTTKALGDITRFHRQKFNIPVIAVTGSNGKTTTKEMIAQLLSGKFTVLKNEGTKNNHIGLPMTLLRLRHGHSFAVLEAGTNHPGEIDELAGICLPNVAVITNVGPSHLQHFKDERGVYREKAALLKYLKSPRLAIFNADCRHLGPQILKTHKSRVIIGFGINRQADFAASDIRIKGNRLQFVLNHKYSFSLNSIGYYNVYNALAAVALARVFGIGYNDLIKKLGEFEFPKSRLKLLKLNNTNFIDDTYNSNPLSLQHALDVLKDLRVRGRKIFVMGDMLELGDRAEFYHSRAGQRAAEVCDCFIAAGELSGSAIKEARAKGLSEGSVFHCSDSLQARDILFKKITPGPDDIVLVKGSRSMKMEEIFNT